MLSHRTALAVVVFFAAVGALWFLVHTLSKKPAVFLPSAYAQEKPVLLTQKTEQGVTTFRGTLPSVYSCSSLSAGIAAVGGNTPRVTIVLTLLEPNTPCEERNFQDEEFTLTFSPGADTKAPELEGVTINGVIAQYTLYQD